MKQRVGKLLKSFRFDTPSERFRSIFWLTGPPFFVIKCALRLHRLRDHPLDMLLIGIDDVAGIAAFWCINEIFIYVGGKSKR
jgi:hypothetical protein